MFKENLKLALKAMLGNKLRTLLSLLGIVIGVGSVITILTLGESATKSITQSIVESGLETISIFSTSNDNKSIQREFTEELPEKILNNVQDISTVLATNSTRVTLRNGQVSESYTVMGVPANYAEVLDYTSAEGMFFSEKDDWDTRQVVVLGAEAAKSLFPDGNAVGSYVSIFRNQAKSYRVVGVMDEKAASFNLQFDSSVYIPYNTYIQRMEKVEIVGSYLIRTETGSDVLEVSDNLETYLDRLVGEGNYRVFSPSTIAEMASSITGTLSLVLAAIAAISLLVGGIGIMNIMLVSVAERTKEIGIRKALGAPPSVIRGQFITEAVTLTLIGGIFGVIFGTGVSLLATNMLGWSLFPQYFSYLLAVGFSMLVGIFFGWYPAMKASKLDPIEALNYE
ncbi:MAG: ABC transporter permease [Spirochaetales bacterium]|nr:ABC transporter permease [Spirochaetales bacterium]